MPFSSAPTRRRGSRLIPARWPIRYYEAGRLVYEGMRFAHRLLWALFTTLTIAECAPPPGDLAVDTSYALATTNPTVNEPVFVEFTIHNWLSEGVVSELAMNYHGYGGFWGKITRPDGQTDEGPKVHPSELVAIERVSIAPSESSSKILLVNKWFDFDEPGRYVLEVGIKKPLRTESGVKVTERASGRLIIEVGPRDPVRLEKICARLEREILASPGASSAAAEEALTHIKDPVAVPFLAHLLQAQDGKLAYVYAAALEHIADGPAIDALSDFVNDKSEDRRESARSSLDRIARRSDDLAIKRKIAEALR